jgi:hypothetical protein
MRLRRSLVAVVATIVAVSLAVPGVSASTPHALHIVKECSEYTGANPSFCTITASNLSAIPAGTKVWYYGPVNGSSVMWSSITVMKATSAKTATGYCLGDNRSGIGMCTFWKGTGSLRGFHALINVACSGVVCKWDGTYYFSGK